MLGEQDALAVQKKTNLAQASIRGRAKVRKGKGGGGVQGRVEGGKQEPCRLLQVFSLIIRRYHGLVRISCCEWCYAQHGKVVKRRLGHKNTV